MKPKNVPITAISLTLDTSDMQSCIIRNRHSKYNVCKRNSSSNLNMAKKGVHCTNITLLGPVAEIILFHQRSKFMTCESIVGDYDRQKCSSLYLIHLSCGVHHPTTEVEGELKLMHRQCKSSSTTGQMNGAQCKVKWHGLLPSFTSHPAIS